MIKKVGDEFCVFTKDGSRRLGCHPTEEEARQQLRAIEASKHSYADEQLAALVAQYAMNPKAAKGLWAKWSGSEHPHAACVAAMQGKVEDVHAFCTAVEQAAAGTTPAERMARKHAVNPYRLSGVELFAAGVHNGDKYAVADLDAMVSAFGMLDFQPAIKLGHDDSPGHPAYGYIENLRRVGDKLVADFVNLPQKVYEAIRDKLYNRVSAEVYWNFERAGKKFSRVLKAVALLGAEVPGVAGLKPLADLFANNWCSEVKFYELNLALNKESIMDEQEIKELKDKIAAAEATAKAEKDARDATEKRHKDELADLEKRFGDALKKAAAGGGSDEYARTVANLTNAEHEASIKRLREQVLEAEQIAKRHEEKASEAERRMAAQEAALKKLQAAQLDNETDAVAKTCLVPALRQHIRQFLKLAASAEGVKVYNEKGDAVSPTQAIEEFISFVNGNARVKLFDIKSHEDQSRKAEGDAGAEVDKRVRKYMEQHNEKDYRRARDKVLEADPALKEEYAQSMA